MERSVDMDENRKVDVPNKEEKKTVNGREGKSSKFLGR